jgi:hypothetical protein
MFFAISYFLNCGGDYFKKYIDYINNKIIYKIKFIDIKKFHILKFEKFRNIFFKFIN